MDLEIFEQTSSYCELRLSSGGELLKTRGLDTAAVDRLIEIVEHDYSHDTIASQVFKSPRLSALGADLAAFLDGDQRWLTSVLDSASGMTLRITAATRLRYLPWELLCVNGSFLSVSRSSPLLPVRAAGTSAALPAPAIGNRPLRVLFMATSPEGVEPVLNFEAEEAAILAATSQSGIDLVVEESGTLAGLRFRIMDYGAEYFDVLHLSGHASLHDGQPVFLVEDEFGGMAYATADKVAQALAGRWPRLIFVSASFSGGATSEGLPSMSESLVRAGAPAVLGWALPVGDVSATEFAAGLYRALAAGEPLDQAVIAARRSLYHRMRASWHLLRMYADRSPLAAMVTPLNSKGRAGIGVRAADQKFLDPQTQLSRVAARSVFVGRRRVIQRCLRTLKQPAGAAGGAEGLVLHGMGGLGKSSLASRLLERMPTHQRAVWYGRVDLTKFRELTDKIQFPAIEQQIEAAQLLDNEQVPLPVRLRYLLRADGPLGATPCLFVFDDFEVGNLDPHAGSHILSPAMAEILPALLKAIRDTGSRSRVIVTSRYRFPTPAGCRITIESLETLTAIEQAKKLANLTNLRPGSTLDAGIRTRAIEAAAGNPRLLDWLDLIAADNTLDVDLLLTAITDEAERFRRETILATNLLHSQPVELQRMLAKVNVVELPIPFATVSALVDHPDAAGYIERATQLGLLEMGTDPISGQARFYVSSLLSPLIRPLLTDGEYVHACVSAARSLYEEWGAPFDVQASLSKAHEPDVQTPQRTQRRWSGAHTSGALAQMVVGLLEVHRLAVAGRDAAIARQVGGSVGRAWLRTSRFADVDTLATATLTLGPDAGAFYDRGGARASTGQPRLALGDFQEALTLYRAADDRGNEAATLTNIGLAYYGLGDRQQALTYYAQALPIQREVGDRAGEAVTLTNIGLAYYGLGDRQQALTYYAQALPIQREVGDRAGEAVTLTNIGLAYYGLGDRQQALTYYAQALPIQREVGDRAGEAVTLTNIGLAYYGLGDRQQALTYYAQALPIQREVGDRAGEAVTLTNIGLAYYGLGDRQQALTYYAQALPIQREVGDRAGEAVTLTNIGLAYYGLGDRQQALTYYAQALPIQREVGDRAGEAVTLTNIAMIHRDEGDLDQAITEFEHVVELDRQVGHPDLAADTAALEQLRQQRAQDSHET
ncbi:tetratricopeptide (TPR) repeat protein [Allocatelliglobosispora scoriae]|uniref:Tetratricopeptide (TPR) repeat protein n=1 Tax=Allocatelliglobosispora scoriae TaxID=643052 RepID=A0A841BHK9_9ACTN|nr:tetratricopeptide repeat protein [Allocatelliglobosispora scoriae]MBB5866669.1 tetratricopeptide (TPR) repeat protein [Allocatelliglobosispora scoriae]